MVAFESVTLENNLTILQKLNILTTNYPQNSTSWQLPKINKNRYVYEKLYLKVVLKVSCTSAALFIIEKNFNVNMHQVN